MPGANNSTPKILAGVAGILAAALIAVPILAPQSSVPDATEPGPGAVLEDPAPVDYEIPPPPTSDDSSAAPADTDDSTSEVVDPQALLMDALAAYETQLDLAGGVSGSFISADSQEMLITLHENGDFRAVTTNPNAPEWLYVNPVLYARLGEAELKAQQEALVAINKPKAIWTDAAMNGDQQGLYLSAGNIQNAVADLSPIMTDVVLVDGEDGTTIIQGTIDLTKDLGLNANAYNLKPVDPDAEASAIRLATVVFTIDSAGVLQGYIVQPPGSAQPVSLLLTKFAQPSIKKPSPDRVITLEDLAPIMEDSPTSGASPSPSVATP